MSCVTCGGEASTRSDDSMYCTSCATNHEWASVLDAIQGGDGYPSGNGASPKLDFETSTHEPDNTPDEPPADPSATEEPELGSVAEPAPNLSPFAELHEDAQTSVATSDTLVDDSMLRAIEELAKSLETVAEVEETRAKYADDVVEATDSELDASAPTSEPRYAPDKVAEQAPESLATSADEPVSPAASVHAESNSVAPAAAGASVNQKADPFA